jgi:hypothetical protein
MATKKPLGNYAGTVQEMPAGDVIAAANGGTGLSSSGASGNVLTSDGTNWVSSTPAGGGGVTEAQVVALVIGLS